MIHLRARKTRKKFRHLRNSDRVLDTFHKNGDVAFTLCRSSIRSRAEGVESEREMEVWLKTHLVLVCRQCTTANLVVNKCHFCLLKWKRTSISHHPDDASKYKPVGVSQPITQNKVLCVSKMYIYQQHRYKRALVQAPV